MAAFQVTAEVEKTAQLEIIHTKVVIEKVYKGNLRVGQEIVFAQGAGGNCFKEFDDDDVASKFLFYLKPKEKIPNVWYADDCERSKALPGSNMDSVTDAADDLSYLEKMDKVSGKTRISGRLFSYQWSFADGGADFKKVTATKVRLIGEKQTYEIETNEDGLYEIYDLPPGRYKVEPDVPNGWAIDTDSSWSTGASSGREDTEHSQLTLKKGRHAYFDFFFKADTRVKGRVFNPSGSPMRNVCVSLIPTEGKVFEHYKAIDCTEDDGSFEIDEVPFGRYFALVNTDEKISVERPFRQFYYPNVYERAKAEVITIVEGDVGKTIEIHVPEVKEVVEIDGSFLSADGNPVTMGGVAFLPEKTDEQIDGTAFTRTDENGRFSLRVLKGLKGKLVGSVSLDDKEFIKCPQVIALLKAKGNYNWQDQQTDAIEIQTQGSVDNVVLKLSFPSCKGGKITSLLKID